MKDMKRIGAAPADIERLENAIAANPETGDLIPGLGGIRKLRFGLGGKGRRGGGRAIYFLMLADDAAALVMAYAKSAQADLTAEQRKSVASFVREFTDGRD